MSQLKYKLSNLPLISAGEAATANFFVSLSIYHFNHTYGEEKKQFSPAKWAADV